MHVEIISVGDELLIGQIINTNAAWMGAQLLNIGIQASWVTTVGDEEARITEALRIANARADVILLTGGLGPTHDDVTKTALCQYFDCKLVLDLGILEYVKSRFQRRGIPMAKVNEGQAMIPEKAEIIFNELGTAPGLCFRRPGKTLYVMPGVPFEMQAMMQKSILPELKKAAKGQVIAIRVLCTTGIAESTLFEKLGDVARIEAYAKIAFLPSLGSIRMRLTCRAKSDDEARSRLDEAEALIRAKVNSYIFADEELSLEEVVGRMLITQRKTVAIAESCTGGLVSHKLTNISGSSAYFDRTVVSYSNKAKMEELAVPSDLIEKHGAVSAEIACAMADGVRRIAQTDYGISTTGIAGPTGGSDEKPLGLVFTAVADAQSTSFERHQFTGDRLTNKERFAYAALNLLRKKLQNIGM
jgi:nicotinamide-nucleotide amidase